VIECQSDDVRLVAGRIFKNQSDPPEPLYMNEQAALAIKVAGARSNGRAEKECISCHPAFFSCSYVSLSWTPALLLTHFAISFKAKDQTPPDFHYLSFLPDDRAFLLWLPKAQGFRST
jgi:hypothetical protein